RFRHNAGCAATIVLILCSSLFGQAGVSAQGLTPAVHDFARVDQIMEKAVSDGVIPGGVIIVGHNGQVIHRKAYGWRSLEPTREAMSADTIFDLASLTKCVATATSIVKLLEEGKLRLNDPVAAYLPEFGKNGKENITIRQLLTHFSGLREDLDLKQTWSGSTEAYRMAMDETPVYPPGARFLYSDINYETLGFIVEKVSGMPLDRYAEQNIFAPLGMTSTRFNPPVSWSSRIAPTEYDEQKKMLRGIVHDPTARRMGGVAGHAGLFSTADDLAIFAQEMLTGSRILSRLSIEKMTTPQQPANAASLRGLGWDIDSPFASNRGELLPVGSFGHTGFTGTSLWMDPTTNTYVILLTSAVHPNGGKSVVSLRARVANAVVTELALNPSKDEKLRLARITGYNESTMAARRVVARQGSTKAGIDVLESSGFAQLHPDPSHPVRVGIVTNQTGVDAQGRRTIDAVAAIPGLRVTAIFSPEHGITGTLDTTKIGGSSDVATGAPVYSVYGEGDASRRPSRKVLDGLDLIIYDIQDIGVRFYTYETTLGYFLEAAARAGKNIVVLDRPNPISGAIVQGPVADPGHESFVGYWKTPVRHGMTVGELARMFNEERGIHAHLTVVSMEGWMRGDWFDSTGRLWIDPSPNMRSLTEATLYPGVGLIEGTNISVGRGTNTPFELVGAPWVNALELAAYLNAREIGGVRFVPVNFTPTASNYANQFCGGVNIQITDRGMLDAPELGMELASALQTLYPKKYDVSKLDWLLIHKASFEAIRAGQDPRMVGESWRDGLERFQQVRAKYLLY
ncbi:MAG TPA: serine hydrolase, partial [Candidatus Acidoferrales bacterium]|nr:serine hydrolase [Candidatus Acidoferrales bacterium]